MWNLNKTTISTSHAAFRLLKWAFFFTYFSHFFQHVSGAAPHSRHVWRRAKLPLSSPGPVTTQLSAPALIIILLPTNTAQLALETLTPRLPQAGREREREKKTRAERN